MKNSVLPALALASLLGVALPACAGVVFASHLPNTADIGANLLSDTSSGPSDVAIASPAGFRLTRIEWWGFDAMASDSDDFLVTFNGATMAGLQGDLGETEFPGSSDADPKLKHYFLDVTTDAASAAMNVLSVFNQSFAAEWYWQLGQLGQAGPMGPAGAPGHLSYVLFGEPPAMAVPEPASLALVLAALAAAGGAPRRRA